MWFSVAVINIFLPHKSYSENENRYLANIPAYSFAGIVNGKYMSEMENYLNDQFLLRDSWINAQSVLEYALGKRESNNVFIGNDALISKIQNPNRDYVNNNISGINYFSSLTDMPISLMIVPSASEIQPEKLPIFAEVWNQQEEIQQIYGLTQSAKCISIYDILSNHKDEYIFYRTDHHWTTYGAYLAYTEFCRENGLIPSEYSADTVSSSFNGTLYSSSGVRFIKSDTIEAFKNSFDPSCEVFNGKETESYSHIYFPEFLEKKDKYAYFLNTNQPIVTLHGEMENGPSLLIFKDSYAHCFAPMLLEHYSKITLLDLRYISPQPIEQIDMSDYDSALFLYSIDSFVNQNDIYKIPFLIDTNDKE